MVLQFFLYLCKYNVKIRKIAINIARKNIKILRCIGNMRERWTVRRIMQAGAGISEAGCGIRSKRPMVKGTHGDFRETRLRGNVDFPFELYEMRSEGSLICVDCHWQEEVELLRVERGGLNLSVDGTQQQLYPGDIAFVNPGQMHQMKGMTRDTMYYAYVFPMKALLFEQEDLAQVKILRPLLENQMGFPTVLRGALAGGIRDRVDAVIAWNRNRPVGYEILTKAGLLEMICILGQQDCFIEYHANRQNDVCKEILLYIQNHYREKISIPEIARAVGISENYFSSFFARHLMKSFAGYLMEYRINQSCILLETTELSVTDIALECGFSTPSYYIQSFRKLKKMTPYRYKHGESGARGVEHV